MKIFGKFLIVVLFSGVAVGQAWADRGWRHPHSSIQFGINVGPVWGYPPYPVYPYWPRVYVPPVIVAPSPPPTVYIEQTPPPPAPVASVPALEPGYWYYCQESGAYYPHVTQCAGDWHKVPPQQPGK